jgi:dipeptidyl aminopeptidase/acylaminoacyl peptidase
MIGRGRDETKTRSTMTPNKGRRAFQFLVAFYLMVLGVLLARAQQNPIPPEELLNVHLLGEGSPPDFSPDGSWIAYAVRNNLRGKSSDFGQTDAAHCSEVPWHAQNSWIVLKNIQSGATTRLGGGDEDSWLPRWSPDGKYVVFLSDRDGGGRAKLWVWERSNNRVRRLSDVVVVAEEIEWTADSREILTTVEHGNGTTEESDCQSAAVTDSNSRAVSSAPVIVYESHPQAREAESPGPWNLDRHIRDLAFFDVENGEMRKVSDGERIEWFRLSPDGSRAAYSSAKRFERDGSQQIRFDLVVVARKDSERSVAAGDIRLFVRGRAFGWDVSGNGLIFETGGPLETRGDCYWTSVDGGKARNLTRFASDNRTAVFFPPTPGPDGTHFYFLRDGAVWETTLDGQSTREFAKIPGREIVHIVTAGGGLATTRRGNMIVVTRDEQTKRNGFYALDLRTASFTVLLERDECYWFSFDKNFISVSPDGEMIVYSAQDAGHPLDLWVSDTGFRNPRNFTHLNAGLERYAMGAAELIDWRSLDGEELRGALLLPPGYNRNRKYPLLVWVYGGANLSEQIHEFGFTGLGQPINLQMFATRGYVVLAPDAPQHLGTPMLDLLKTILPGVDRVVEMGIADPGRIGVVGQSYGGYSVMSLLALTSRFKAAVAVDGFADLLGAYGQLNADGTAYAASREHGQEQMGGDPWQYRDRYIENSPIFYLDRVKTPLLLVHGTDDEWVHPSLSDEVFVGLRRLGKEVSYAKYPGEGHTPDIWNANHQLDLSNRILDWFARYLGDSASGSEKNKRE